MNLQETKEFLERKSMYILDENKNVIPASILEWGRFKEKFENKCMKQEDVNDKWVSTVFIGIDHGFCTCEYGKCNCPPIVFETMVFNKGDDWGNIYCDRYTTYEEALKGHEKAVQWVKDGFKESES